MRRLITRALSFATFLFCISESFTGQCRPLNLSASLPREPFPPFFLQRTRIASKQPQRPYIRARDLMSVLRAVSPAISPQKRVRESDFWPAGHVVYMTATVNVGGSPTKLMAVRTTTAHTRLTFSGHPSRRRGATASRLRQRCEQRLALLILSSSDLYPFLNGRVKSKM